MSTVKIVFVTTDKQIVIYGQGLRQLWQVETYVLEHLGEVLSQMQPEIGRANIRKYWIDDEGDQVEILNDVDYDFFLKRMGSHRTPKIYFEAIAKPASPQAEAASAAPRTGDLSVHKTVSCDECQQQPIVGFRYKCLQCKNYDLCMKCEAAMKHKDHILLRIPTGDSMLYQSFLPTSLFASKRLQKKFAAAAAAAASGSNTDEGGCEGKSRHRHHRRHCGSGSGGYHMLSNFYQMMQDLAEGGASPSTRSTPESPEKAATDSAAAEAAAAAYVAAEAAAKAAAEAAENVAAVAATVAAETAAPPSTTNRAESKETNTSPDRSANTAQNGSPHPSLENLQNFIDPQFMKAGIQILNNFSEMFGKILDPVVTTDGARTGSSVASDIDLTGEDSRASASPKNAATPNKPGNSKAASGASSGDVTPMEADGPPSQPTPASSPRGEENDWTMIDNSVPGVVLPDAVTGSSSTDAASTSSQKFDFAKLSQQLQSHFENEKNTPVPVVSAPETPTPAPTPSPVVNPAVITLPTPVSIPLPPPASAPVHTPAPVAPAPAPQAPERRAVAVYHPDERINSAVHAMMAMGFSNEGAMLTQLLVSVNGDIPKALDLMTYAQRT